MLLNRWKTEEDVLEDFRISKVEMKGRKIIFGSYDISYYEGYAFVLLEGRNGNLYEINGSHCSCYGLEGQWDRLEETTNEAIKHRIENGGMRLTLGESDRVELMKVLKDHKSRMRKRKSKK